MDPVVLVSSGQIVFPAVKSRPGHEIIIDVAAKHRLTPKDLIGFSRKADVVGARHRCMYALALAGFSTTQIGIMLGRRDHTTVVSALKKFPPLSDVWRDSWRKRLTLAEETTP